MGELTLPGVVRFKRHLVWGLAIGVLSVGLVFFLIAGGASDSAWESIGIALFFCPGVLMGVRYARVRLELREDGVVAANLFSTQFVAWSDIRDFGFGQGNWYGLVGWIERLDNSRLGLDGFGSRWWMINAGFDGPARRIADLNRLLERLRTTGPQ